MTLSIRGDEMVGTLGNGRTTDHVAPAAAAIGSPDDDIERRPERWSNLLNRG